MSKVDHSNDNFLKVEIITPEVSLSFDDIHMAIMPGSEGEFGVMFGHVPMIVSLDSGVIHLQQGKHLKIIKISISSGFVEITNKYAVILVEKAEELPHS